MIKKALPNTSSSKSKDGAGFTLIELIVVFSIFSILSALGLASFVTYSRAQAVTTERNNLIQTLNVAKSRAQSQVKPSTCTTLVGYSVVLDTANERYTLNALCKPTNQTVSTTNFAQNIDLYSANPSTYAFPVLTGGATTGTIVIRGYGISQTITVNANGIN